jgi:hypothetical protein
MSVVFRPHFMILPSLMNESTYRHIEVFILLNGCQATNALRDRAPESRITYLGSHTPTIVEIAHISA